jgi:dipeptidyl aminopeptidase/acylaminoacyl peptidase
MRSSALLAASLLALSVPAHAADEALTLQPTRPLKFTATTATWTQLDLSPDGRTILFDLLGDIYVLDAKGGGAARPVLTGMAFESNPVFSPDGKRFAFVSDRSGAMNLWIANLDGTGLKQLSRDSGMEVWSSPAWSPDGSKVYASRMTRPRLAFELFLFDVDGGAGVQITEAGSPSNWDTRHNALGAVASPDGNFLYYSTKLGHTWTEDDPPNWQIARRDLRTGAEDMAVSAPGGALHPALSHDGRLLAYASRNGAETGLRLRDLVSGEDRWIAAKIDHDAQEGGYYADLTPRFTFVPDDKSIVMGLDGGIARLDIATADPLHRRGRPGHGPAHPRLAEAGGRPGPRPHHPGLAPVAGRQGPRLHRARRAIRAAARRRSPAQAGPRRRLPAQLVARRQDPRLRHLDRERRRSGLDDPRRRRQAPAADQGAGLLHRAPLHA